MTIRGTNIPVYPLSATGEVTTLDHFKRAYDDLQAVGGNGVALNPVHYASLRPHTPILAQPPKEYGIRWFIWPDVGQGQHGWPQTVSPDLVYAACVEAKARGLTVMLKPMVDPEPGGWRGNISVKGEWEGKAYDLSADWRYAYTHRFLSRYIEIANSAGVDALCVGTEMVQVTKELGVDFWHGVDTAVTKAGYAGMVTYAANWGWADDAEYNRLREFWTNIGSVGVDAYFPLTGEGVPVDAKYEQAVFDGWHRRGIEADWCPRIDDDLMKACGGDPGQMWFTEVGYRADEAAAINPGEDPSSRNAPYSEAAQIACWRAFRHKWGDSLGAYFAWSWELHTPSDPRSHNLRGRGEAAEVALGATV